MRKLVTVRRISAIDLIPGAEAIDVATVDGWKVVVKKGEFSVGDLAEYYEIDSWVPEQVAPFLFKGREYEGVKGERLRTIKLRGQVSQGLLLPLSFPAEEGEDLTDRLGVIKWEKPVPVQMQGQMRGDFPGFIKKTDQERVQNLPNVFDDLDSLYEISLKLDGSSMTVWFRDGEWGVCSRNIDLKLDQEGNIFVDTAKRIFTYPIRPKSNLAFQGELMGPGIQGNREGLLAHEFFVFNVWNIDRQEYMAPSDAARLCSWMGIGYVPTLGIHSLSHLGLVDMESMLAYAEGPSMKNSVREGLVFKRVDGKFSFKVISNRFLLKEST